MGAPAISFAQVSLGFAPGGPLVLDDLSFEVAPGEVLVVLGPSGCGKTTMLRLIAGLLTPDAGQITVNGHAPQPGQDSALVFQNFRLLPWKTVAQNVAFVLPHLPAHARAAQVARCLDLVGLSRFAGAYPRALSGGMQQRTALARALAAEPDILLLDEPFASLDAQSRELMQGEVLRLTRAGRGGAPRSMVFVTHSVDEALLLADRVLLMSPRPGRIADLVALPFARSTGDRRADPAYGTLRDRLWQHLREMVLRDPQSDFYGRDASAPQGPQ